MRHRPAKKSWRQAVDNLRLRHAGTGIGCLSGLFGKTREGYYSVSRERRNRLSLTEMQIAGEVRRLRGESPGIGAYKLFLILKGIFPDAMPGRDRFYSIVHRHGLMLKPERRRHTTSSNHNYRKYRNLVKGFVPARPNQLWVADITYIETDDGVAYLHLLTDAWTHEIIGWVLSGSLLAENTVAALEMGISHSGGADLSGLIHHSDRGSQYCSNAYVERLKSVNARISMTEDYKPTDNAVAERVNGIIKQEWLYRMKRPKDMEEARKLISGIVDFYNNKRPHMSNGMMTPAQKRESHEAAQTEAIPTPGKKFVGGTACRYGDFV